MVTKQPIWNQKMHRLGVTNRMNCCALFVCSSFLSLLPGFFPFFCLPCKKVHKNWRLGRHLETSPCGAHSSSLWEKDSSALLVNLRLISAVVTTNTPFMWMSEQKWHIKSGIKKSVMGSGETIWKDIRARVYTRCINVEWSDAREQIHKSVKDYIYPFLNAH